ncbi:hypothetical protein HDZ31DRAFT_66398 [Schizophyllum fasciatum]
MQRGQAYEGTLEDNLKSLFFALLTICLSFDAPDRPRHGSNEPAVLSAWRQSAAHALQSRTTVQDLDTFTKGVLDVMAPYFKSLRPCLTAMHAALFKDEDEEQAAAAAPEDALTAARGVARALQNALDKGLQSMKVVPVGVIRRPRTSLGELPAASNIAVVVEEQKEATQPKGKKGPQAMRSGAKKARAHEQQSRAQEQLPHPQEQQPQATMQPSRATRQQPARLQAHVKKSGQEPKEPRGKKQTRAQSAEGAQAKGAKEAQAGATKLVIRIPKRKREEEAKEAEDVQPAQDDSQTAKEGVQSAEEGAQPAKEEAQPAKKRKTVAKKAKVGDAAPAAQPAEAPAVPLRRSMRRR